MLFIDQSLLHHNPPNIWIKITQIEIQIECLHGTKFLNPDCNLDLDPHNFNQCKQVQDVFRAPALPEDAFCVHAVAPHIIHAHVHDDWDG